MGDSASEGNERGDLDLGSDIMEDQQSRLGYDDDREVMYRR